MPNRGERVRILFFVGDLWTGGLEKQLLHLASGLDRNRFEVVVWTAGEWGLVGDALRERRVTVFERPMDVSTSRAVDDTIQWLRELEIILFFSFASRFWPDTVMARTAGIPLCFTRRSSLRDGRMTLEERVRNADSDITVALCRAMETECLEVEEIVPERLAVIYNGVVLPESVPSRRDGWTIGNVANYRPLKGQAELVRALPGLPDAELLIVGRTAGELDPLITELGLQGKVRFTGEVAEPSSIYVQMSVYAHPSWAEGLPGAVLEAMAHGLAVVGTPAGGMPEIVEQGVTGYLVPFGDVGALKDALAELLRNPLKSRQMGMEGRARVRERYTVERMVAEYERLFEARIALLAPVAPG